MSRTIEETLRDLLAGRPSGDRYDEGYRDGYDAARKELEAALGKIQQSRVPRATHQTSPPTPQQPPTSSPGTPPPTQAKNLPAPEKDRLVRDYLAAHPNVKYKDLARDLTRYVATRVYALVERGEVLKAPDGTFRLTPPSRGDENGNLH